MFSEHTYEEKTEALFKSYVLLIQWKSKLEHIVVLILTAYYFTIDSCKISKV